MTSAHTLSCVTGVGCIILSELREPKSFIMDSNQACLLIQSETLFLLYLTASMTSLSSRGDSISVFQNCKQNFSCSRGRYCHCYPRLFTIQRSLNKIEKRVHSASACKIYNVTGSWRFVTH